MADLTVIDKRPNYLEKPLSPEDVTDASISTLERATILRVPAALEVAHFLKNINGRPLGECVLVLPLPRNDRYGYIIIPEDAQEDQACGIVVGVGKGRYENGVLIPPDVSVGNYVAFSKYSAKSIDLAGVQVFQIAEGDITFAAGE